MRTKELALLLLSPLSTVTGPRVAAPLFYPCSKCVNVVMFLNKSIVTLGNTVLALTMCTRCTTDCQNNSPSLCLLSLNVLILSSNYSATLPKEYKRTPAGK